MSEQKNNQETESTLNRIGLALSGGGFRASLYHLGTIRYLEEAGIMESVEAVSTVSGGSIIGAYYLIEREKMLRVNPKRNRLEVCDQIIKKFSEQLKYNFRMRAVVFYPFYHPVQMILRILKIRHLGDTMAKAFERKLFAPSLRVGSLPVQYLPKNSKNSKSFHTFGTRLLLNATSLITGKRVVHSRENETGVKGQINKSNPNYILLARVVGASAAVPGLFNPLKIGNEILADGGVVDNQGLETLFDYFEISDESSNLLEKRYRQLEFLRERDKSDSASTEEKFKAKGDINLIISDGAGQFSVKSSPPSLSGSAMRSMEVLQTANRSKVLQLLLDKHTNKQINSFAFTHMAMNLKGRKNISGRLPTEYIVPTAELRTDLDDFSLIEREALIYHGYTLMKAQIEMYLSHLIDSSNKIGATSSKENWPPKFIKLSIAKDDTEEVAAEKTRMKISKFLSVGSSLLFKDVQRFPMFFAPILIVFIIAWIVAAHSLIAHTSLDDRLVKWFELILNCKLSRDTLTFLGLESLWKAANNLIVVFTKLIIYAFGFYVSMWGYWELKVRLKLSYWSEVYLLKKLEGLIDKK